VIGWALWRRLQRQLERRAYPSPVRDPVASPDAEEPQIPAASSEAVEAPETVETVVTPPGETVTPDDLTRIEGIGPKVAAILHEVEIDTYAQLAQTEVGVLKDVLREAGLAFMNPASWPEQAALAASGEETALDELQEQLKGGRR
jgi:small subunit ribosomal protein S2